MKRGSSEISDTIQRIKAEIETLKQQQSEAMKAATYLGMTVAEARLHEERRVKITKLVEEFGRLAEQISPDATL